MVAVPALYPDLAVVHVHESDPFGNCRIEGISVADLDVARSAKRLIITCERVISNDEIPLQPDANSHSPFYWWMPSARCRWEAIPATCPTSTTRAKKHIRQWLAVEEDLDEYRGFLDHHIFEVSDHQEYVRRAGGLDRLEELRRLEFMETS
ncbi:MAG: hypothetical protein CM1200mP2_18890 [Planctomycetaceae bacterium]|nr:MAG: hypothetical protein CM1200mP2_18890 [Planctomycetaceae bacterium]